MHRLLLPVGKHSPRNKELKNIHLLIHSYKWLIYRIVRIRKLKLSNIKKKLKLSETDTCRNRHNIIDNIIIIITHTDMYTSIHIAEQQLHQHIHIA